MDDVARAVAKRGDLVGRDGELAELVSVLGIRAAATPDPSPQGARAEADVTAQPVAVLLAGDAGIGKTRLLEALAERAHDAGWWVFVGHSLDLGEGGLPYLPFSEVVARIAEAEPAVIAEATATHPALARLEPVRRVLDRSARPEGDLDRLERGALFEAVRYVLECVAETGPVLVVMEDLHWADPSTRDLLSFLLSRPFAAPVGLVASYRSDDLHRRHPLRPQIAEWARLRGVHRIQLEPLAPAHVHTLIARLHPGPLPADRARAIVERAEGNAFFVEELVGALTDPDSPLPADLADLLLIRLDRLDDVARQVVRVAGVAGRRVSHSLLAAASGVDSERLDEALRQAVGMNVLRTDGEHYAFRHALLAEAAYDDLLPGERVRLHARYVAALQQRRGSGTAAELAHHARRAMDRQTALSASIEAAREAMSVGGPADATRHYDAALELLADPDLASGAGFDVSVIVAEAADALVASGHVVRAAALLAEQLDRLPREATASQRARLLSARASALIIIEPDEDPVVLSQEAVRLLAGDDGPLRARVLATHARILSQAELWEQAQAAGLEAIALAEQLRLPLVVSDALTTISRLGRPGSAAQSRTALADAVQQARQAGNVSAELRGEFWLGLSYVRSDEIHRAEENLRIAMELGVAAGTPYAPYAFESRWFLGWVLVALGRWDEALVVLTDPDESPPPIPGALLDVQRLQVLLARGQGGAERLPAMRVFWPVEGMLAVHSAGLEIEVASRSGRLAGALAAYDDVVEVISRIWGPHFEAQLRLATTALTAVADAVTRLPTTDRGAATQRAERLYDDTQRVLEHVAERGAETAAWAALAEAERARVHWLTGEKGPAATDLVAAWRTAVQGFERFGHVYLAVRTAARLAEILIASGDADGGRAVAATARQAATRLGAAPLVAQLDRLAPGPRAPEPSARAGAPAEELTHREAEVLALVAEGLSNGEIGKRLFITTKTVSVHVSHILAKLGASGRTEAAALARRRGLLVD